MDVITYVLGKKYADEQMKNIPGYLESVRSELKAIQDIMTLERSDPIIQPGQIDSLGGPVAAGAVDGVVEMSVKGRTGRNLIENGDFAEGIAGWAPTYGVLSVIDNVAIIVGDGSASSIWLENTLHGREADRSYYGVCLARVRDSTCDTLRIVVAGGGVKSVENPVNDRWYVLPAKHTAIGDHNKLIAVQAIYPDAATANGKTLEVQEVSAIDLDAENLTGKTADEINTMFPDWFDGTKSTGPKRMKSLGKNLFPYKISKLKDINDGVVGINYYSTTLKLKSDTDYTAQINISEVIGAGFFIYLKGQTNNYMDFNAMGLRYATCKSNLDGTITLGLYKWDTGSPYDINLLSNLMLSEGTTAAAYEPYKQSLVYTPEVGQSLPNGVADEVDVNEGIKTKNIQEHILQSEDMANLNTILTNYDSVSVIKPVDMAAFTSKSSGQVVSDSKQTAIGVDHINWDSPEYIDTIFASTGVSSSRIIITFPKGTYADLAAAQADLAGTVIHYQLAEPETIHLPPQNLLSFENGTLLQEHVIGEVAFYATNCPVSDVKYPIQSLDFIKKVDQTTGAMTDLDPSTAVIAPDGLSFTQSDLTVGDLVDWDYYYSSELSTLAEPEYTVPLANVKSSIIRTQQLATKSADYTVTADDYIILADGSTTAVNVTLPSALVSKSLSFKVKAVNITNAIKILTEGAETIDGATDYTFATANEVIEVVGDGANWVIV